MKALLTKTLVIATVALVADQLTKSIARGALDLCTAPGAIGCDQARIGGPVELIRVANAGSAFGFAQDLWLWVPLAALGSLLVLLYARAGVPSPVLGLAAGLQLGGALGNLLDRLLFSGVTDFIYLGAGPVFNVADLALAAGTVLAARALWTAQGTNVRTEAASRAARSHPKRREEVRT